MNLVRSCRENRYAVYLVTLLLVAAGTWALFVLPSNIYPELNFPRVQILVHAGDLSPDAMLLTVTRPIEEACSSVLGVRRVRSRTIRGAAEISILFKPDMDMQYGVQLVQARVSETRSSLPPDADILVSRVTPAVFPVLSLILNGDVPGTDLRDKAFYVLRPLFSRVPGVGQIEVQSSDTREVSVIVDPQKLQAYGLALPQLTATSTLDDRAADSFRVTRDRQLLAVTDCTDR
jgi:multidrug efflux pump subunit AcrB